jgi:hypothetical protein
LAFVRIDHHALLMMKEYTTLQPYLPTSRRTSWTAIYSAMKVTPVATIGTTLDEFLVDQLGDELVL